MSCHVTSFIIAKNKSTRTKPAWTRSFPKPTQYRAGQPGAINRDPSPLGPARIKIRLYLPHLEMTTGLNEVSWVGFRSSISSNFRQNKNNDDAEHGPSRPRPPSQVLYIPCALQTPPIFAPVDSIRLCPQSAQLKSSSMFTSMSSG